MQSYKVTKKRFHDGKMYNPEGEGKRNILTVKKAFDPVPDGLEPISETVADIKNRQKTEDKNASDAANKKSKDNKEIEGSSKVKVLT